MSGWIKLHRSIQDTVYWSGEPFSKGQAWIDLLILANHKAGQVRSRGGVVEVPRGGLAWSKEKLSERWKWSRGKVIRFLNELETAQMVVQQTVQMVGVVSICKYEEYQNGDTTDGTNHGTANGTNSSTRDGTLDGTTDGTVTRKKRKKEVKNKDIDSNFSLPDFIPSALWKKYLISRKEKKHPMNSASLELAVKAIEKTIDAGYDVDKTLEAMIEAGWRSVKTEWLKKLEQGSGSNNRQNQRGEIDLDEPFELDQWDDYAQRFGEDQSAGDEIGSTLEGDFSCMETSHS